MYLDLVAICEARDDEASKWADYNEAFKECQTPRRQLRNKNTITRGHQEGCGYLANMMREWEDLADCIYASTNIQ